MKEQKNYNLRMSRNNPQLGTYYKFYTGTLKELKEKCYLKTGSSTIESLLRKLNNKECAYGTNFYELIDLDARDTEADNKAIETFEKYQKENSEALDYRRCHILNNMKHIEIKTYTYNDRDFRHYIDVVKEVGINGLPERAKRII